jgi:hypothetical protein
MASYRKKALMLNRTLRADTLVGYRQVREKNRYEKEPRGEQILLQIMFVTTTACSSLILELLWRLQGGRFLSFLVISAGI